jgi:exopolysaccharide biosynthesis polyprenyl glycosylphosphotransferase
MTQVGNLLRRYFEPILLTVQVLVDLCVVLGACLLAYFLREYVGWRQPTRLITYREVILLTAAVCLVSFHAFRLYSPIKSLLNIEEFKAIAKATTVSFFVLLGLLMFLRTTPLPPAGPLYKIVVRVHQLIDLQTSPDRYSRMFLVLAFGLILVLMMVSRFISFKVIQMLHRRRIGNRNALIYGTGETALRLQRKFVLVPTLGLNLVGFVGERAEEVGRSYNHVPVLGTFDALELLIGRHKISEVFVAESQSTDERVMDIIEKLEALGIIYHVVPRFYHLMTHRVRIEDLDSIPLLTPRGRRSSLLGSVVKRAFDLTVSAVVLTVGAPFFLVPALLIRRETAGPVFYRQKRIGRDGVPFEMLKFRTMHVAMSGDAPAPRSSEDPRITRIGRFLRRYSLDELPQVWNVLRGDMSLVGPRPEMPFIVERYGPLERERLRVKPGLTGLWQISYARSEAIHENIDYDIYYVENQSFLLDVVILVLTAFAIVKGTGAY